MADGFLGRWSRRKIDVNEGKPMPEPTAQAQTQPQVTVPVTRPVTVPGTGTMPAPVVTSPDKDLAAQAELPTLADVEQLTKDSDFKPFVARGVSPQVKNAAMKKLFSDPHFNVMDGLDIYIDDYSLPDPLPQSMIRQMASAQFLKLFEEKEPPPVGAPADPGLPISQTGVLIPAPEPASPNPQETKEQSS